MVTNHHFSPTLNIVSGGMQCLSRSYSRVRTSNNLTNYVAVARDHTHWHTHLCGDCCSIMRLAVSLTTTSHSASGIIWSTENGYLPTIKYRCHSYNKYPHPHTYCWTRHASHMRRAFLKFLLAFLAISTASSPGKDSPSFLHTCCRTKHTCTHTRTHWHSGHSPNNEHYLTTIELLIILTTQPH